MTFSRLLGWIKCNLHLMCLKMNNQHRNQVMFFSYGWMKNGGWKMLAPVQCQYGWPHWRPKVSNKDIFIRSCSHMNAWMVGHLDHLGVTRACSVLLVMFKHKETPSTLPPSPSLFSLCWFTTVWNQPALEACLHGDKGWEGEWWCCWQNSSPWISHVFQCVPVWVYRRQNRETVLSLWKRKRRILLSAIARKISGQRVNTWPVRIWKKKQTACIDK